jgi:hypothetical protein
MFQAPGRRSDKVGEYTGHGPVTNSKGKLGIRLTKDPQYRTPCLQLKSPVHLS